MSKSTKASTAKAPRVRKPKAPKLHPEVAAAEATMPPAVLATKPDASPAVVEVAAVPPVAKRTIEKDREERNGVKRPSAGGACRAVWDFCDASSTPAGPPSVKEVKAHAESLGWNANNASIEYYQWRKFMGIRGRQKAVAAQAEGDAAANA